MAEPVSLPFRDFAQSVPEALAAVGAEDFFSDTGPFLIKPNCVAASPHPITTHPDMVRAIIAAIREHNPSAEIVVAEGAGDAHLETGDIFAALGYDRLARETGVRLVDLNTAPLVEHTIPDAEILPDLLLPEIVFTHRVISAPVLKAHSLAGYTGAIKNMMGILPPAHYGRTHGFWKKASFHHLLDAKLRDLFRHRPPDLSILDASVGMAEFHLGGATCNPPLGRIVAGFDALAVDRAGAAMLGLSAREVGHLA